MATIRLPTDFKEFLKLLNQHAVEYLLIGGYAVGYYGSPRATNDLDLFQNTPYPRYHPVQSTDYCDRTRRCLELDDPKSDRPRSDI